MLNFVLAVLVILGVVFALLTMHKMNNVRTLQQQLPMMSQRFQNDLMHMQAVLNDVVTYNKTANSPELTEILKAAATSAASSATPQPVTK